MAGALLPRLLAADILPNVIDQNTFSLKENGLEKRLYVIFVQIILACKKAGKTLKSQMNFVTPTKFKKGRFLELGLKSQSGNPVWTARSRSQSHIHTHTHNCNCA